VFLQNRVNTAAICVRVAGGHDTAGKRGDVGAGGQIRCDGDIILFQSGVTVQHGLTGYPDTLNRRTSRLCYTESIAFSIQNNRSITY